MKIINIGDKLRELRNSNGLTQLQAGENIGKSKYYIVDWERGKTIPNADDFLELCVSYGVYDILDVFSEGLNEPEINKEIKSLLVSFNVDGQEKILSYMNDISDKPEYKKKTIDAARADA